MEKLYNCARDRYVTIYCKKYNRVYLPKLIFNLMVEKHGEEMQAVDVYIDEKQINIVPNPTGEFTLCRNGSSPNGRNVVLNKSAILYYGVTEGHYPCEVEDDGTVVIRLERKVKC